MMNGDSPRESALAQQLSDRLNDYKQKKHSVKQSASTIDNLKCDRDSMANDTSGLNISYNTSSSFQEQEMENGLTRSEVVSLQQQLKQSSTEPVYDREQYYEASRDVMEKLQNYYNQSTIEEEDQNVSSEDEIDPEFAAFLPRNETEPDVEDEVQEKKNIHKELLKNFEVQVEEPKPAAPEEPDEEVDYKRMIVDASTGKPVDLNSFNEGIAKTTAKVAVPIKPRKNTDPWKKWWRKKGEVNRKFSRAAERGDLNMMKELLDPTKQSQQFVADIDFAGHDNWTPLHYSAIEGQLESVKFLLSKGAKVNALTSIDRTALHIACTRGHSEIAEALLGGANCDINAQDKEQNTALHLSSMYNQLECVDLLLKHDARLDLKNSFSNTPLDVASTIDVAEMLQNYIQDKIQKIKKSARAEDGSGQVQGDYSRMKMGSVIRRTNRSDFVERMLQKASDLGKRGLINRVQAKKGEDEEKEEKDKNDKEKKELKVENVQWEMAKEKEGAKPRDVEEDKEEGALLNDAIKQRMKQLHQQNQNQVQRICIYDSNSEENVKEEIGPHAFEPYQLLGKGSFGEVYLVRKKTNNKFYAMKVLKKKALKAQNLIRYAKTERNVLSITKHNFMVGLNYAFQTGEKLFLLLDYCQGGDLGKMIQRERRLHEEVAKIFCAEIILALEDLHRRDIIFRDLKPENIVIDHEGHAMLTDFGLSKEGVHDFSNRTFCGSVAYLAPEMLQRRGHGKSIDWYLLGVLLYEMLYGHPPFFSYNRDTLFRNILKAQLTFPRKTSKAAEDIMTRLMNREPKLRLGAKEDAAEIKRHPFFFGIDWKKAENRQLHPPKPKLNQIVKKKLPPTALLEFQRPDDNDDLPPMPQIPENANMADKLDGWSFAVPENI